MVEIVLISGTKVIGFMGAAMSAASSATKINPSTPALRLFGAHRFF